MDKTQKRTLLALLVLGVIYFLLFAFPNIKGALDSNMLSVFEPDEFAQYPHVIQMLTPGKTLLGTVFNFVVYRHFYYGYPFYLTSALVLLPVKLLYGLKATTQVMFTLREVISVLPMVLAVIFLVYIQTRFRSFWKSIVLFVLLLSIPAVIKNDLWWHPDSLTILFIVLTFFFLDRDDFAFGNNFLLAAVACGLAVGTKLIGLFFFLAIPIYLVWGLFNRRIDIRQAVVKAVLFVAVMAVTVVVTNPLLLVPEGRAKIIETQQAQAAAMSSGWGVIYASGPASWFSTILDYYGQWFFIILAFIAAILGVLRSSRRILYVLILAYVIPFALYVLFFIAIKPKHFLLPIALPLFSCLAFILPFGEDQPKMSLFLRSLTWVALVLAAVQLVIYIPSDVSQFSEDLYREQTSDSLKFYSALDAGHLTCLPTDVHPVIYRDVRAYVPPSDRWDVVMKWGLVDYDYIRELNPDLVILQQQRIKDYTLQGVLESAVDAAQMQRTYQFYQDAASGNLEGYHLLLQDSFGAAFARQDRYALFQCNN